MRALSVKQPFAELIANGKKKVEHRTWSRQCFGELLIVASKSPHESFAKYAKQVDPDRLVYGKAVCVVDFYNVTGDEGDYHWHVRNPRRVQPVAVAGSASLYHVGDELIRYLDSGKPATTPKKSVGSGRTKSRENSIAVFADGDPARTQQFREALELRGWHVIACADGASAWEAIRRERPSVVVANALLAGLSGLELFYRCRGHAELSSTEVHLIGDRTMLRGIAASSIITSPSEVPIRGSYPAEVSMGLQILEAPPPDEGSGSSAEPASKTGVPFSDVAEEWSRPLKVSRVFKTLGIELPARLRRERLALMVSRLDELDLEVAYADLEPIESKAPSGESKVRLRRKPFIIFGRYQVLQTFNSGGMSEGFKVRSDDGQVCFLKRVRTRAVSEPALRRELGVYSKLDTASTEHLLKFLTFERDDEHLALVTEFADGGTLDEYVTRLGKLRAAEAKSIAQSVLAGLRELHGLGIVHRDLKPANVLLANGRWKLADFGISKDLERLVTQGKTFKEHGTPDFAPPEQWSGTEAHPSADIFAFGKLLGFLLTGRAVEDGLPIETWTRLARRCTARAPDDRPDLEEVGRELAKL